MHTESYNLMLRFARSVLKAAGSRPLRVLEVGSRDINGSYRELFASPQVHQYIGLDVKPGPGVDLVLADPYRWDELRDESVDVIISGQALEHIPYPWLTIVEMARKLKAGGQACLIVPSQGPEHRYPIDCYRYLPDGLRALAEWAGLDVVQVNREEAGQWADCWAILRKPATY